MATIINLKNIKTDWEGKLLTRVIVGVTSLEAIQGISPTIQEEIHPWDLCFTSDGYIVFDNKIFPLNSDIGSKMQMELIKGGVTMKVGDIISLPPGTTVYNKTESKEAIPVFNKDTGVFIFKVGNNYFTHSTCYDDFYNKNDNSGLPVGILLDKIYIYNDQLYLYDKKSNDLKRITFEPYVTDTYVLGEYTLVLDDKPLIK